MCILVKGDVYIGKGCLVHMLVNGGLYAGKGWVWTIGKTGKGVLYVGKGWVVCW